MAVDYPLTFHVNEPKIEKPNYTHGNINEIQCKKCPKQIFHFLESPVKELAICDRVNLAIFIQPFKSAEPIALLL